MLWTIHQQQSTIRYHILIHDYFFFAIRKHI